MSHVSNEMACQELVELVTAYLDGALTPTDRDRFEHHLSDCPGCVEYVEQMRAAVRLTGKRPRAETLPPELRDALLAAFRSWNRPH